MNHHNRTALIALGLVLAVIPLAGGCEDEHGEGCSELCERTSECEDVLGTEGECKSACESTVELMEKGGCSSQWGSYLECLGHSTNLCDTAAVNEECSIQLDGYTACIQPYCDQNPSECSNLPK